MHHIRAVGTACLLAITVTSPAAANTAKERVKMQQAATESAALCSVVLSNPKAVPSTAQKLGFAAKANDKIGRMKFNVTYRKLVGKKAWRKTFLVVARTPQGDCVSKVVGNFESEAYWKHLDATLVGNGYKRSQKPLIVRGMMVGAYKRGKSIIVARGQAHTSTGTVTIWANK